MGIGDRATGTVRAVPVPRTTGTVRAVPVPRTTAARLENLIESNVVKGAKAYTDENKAYGSLHNHETVNHGEGGSTSGEMSTSTGWSRSGSW